MQIRNAAGKPLRWGRAGGEKNGKQTVTARNEINVEVGRKRNHRPAFRLEFRWNFRTCVCARPTRV